MSRHLRPLSTVDDIERVVTESWTRSALIFKHSPTCGISAEAHEEVSEWLSGDDLAADAYLVDVHADRAISNALAARFALRHESPQVLLIARGELLWSASHYHVTARDIAAALRQLAPAVSGAA